MESLNNANNPSSLVEVSIRQRRAAGLLAELSVQVVSEAEQITQAASEPEGQEA